MFSIGQALTVRTSNGPSRGTVIETAPNKIRVRLVDGRVLWFGVTDVVFDGRRGSAKVSAPTTRAIEVEARVVEAEKVHPPEKTNARPLRRGIFFVLFSFAGRIGRADYWKYSILNTLVFTFYGAFCFGVVMALEVGMLVAPRGISRETIEGVLAAFALVPLWWTLAVAVKRLHDRGYSGFFLLVALIPLVGPFWLFFELGLLPGDSQKNRFGEVPA